MIKHVGLNRFAVILWFDYRYYKSIQLCLYKL